MKTELVQVITAISEQLFGQAVAVELTRPDEQFGDYSTNVALQLAGRLGKKPREIAELLAAELTQRLQGRATVSVAGPGFLNISLSDSVLAGQMSAALQRPTLYNGRVVVADYSDPNPFKVLHVGHLYTSVVGDAIMNLIENAGGAVHRTNFGGDVGMHVAKAMWAIVQALGGERPAQLATLPPADRATWIAQRYVEGNTAYETDETAKQSIITMNKRVYQLHTDNDHDSALAQIYWQCRLWSYDYFNAFYKRIGSQFEKYYPESAVADLGLATVRAQYAKGVYTKSDGAIVFEGERFGLHTRVFINALGLPTYEAKDVGLIMTKWQDYHFDRSIVITASDIIEYMKVVLKSIEQFAPELARATTHITHGNVKLKGGVKISSRKGNALLAVDVLDAVSALSAVVSPEHTERTMLAAVKYGFLKQRIGQDVVYDPEESVSLEGNSGPYLQYAHARARSILRKAVLETTVQTIIDLEPAERSLARKVGEYPETVEKATTELLPHYICTYLYELAQTFNRFYEHNRVIGNERQQIRLQLVKTYADTLKNGLELLGITAPDSM